MPQQHSTFTLRFETNASLQPDRLELEAFLASPKRPRLKETHAGDLARYRDLQNQMARFDRSLASNGADVSLADRMFYGALGHTGFCNTGLLSSVEHYKYYLFVLGTLDLRKPAAFIAAAEQELALLDPAVKPDAAKADRLRILVGDRKKTLKQLEQRKKELVRELTGIASYIRNNLISISLLCEKSIVLLVRLLTEGTEERRLINSVKDHFKRELKDGLKQGSVTRQSLLVVQQEVQEISGEIAAFLREDAFAVTSVFEDLHEHTRTSSNRLSTGLAAAAEAADAGFEQERNAFAAIDDILVSLVTGPQFTFKPPRQPRSLTRHAVLLNLKREQMLADFFEQVRKERRERTDRRSGTNRRNAGAGYGEVDRRSGRDRRTGKGRRRQ